MSSIRSEILRRLRGLPGVTRAGFLRPADRDRLAKLTTPGGVENRGVAEVLRRDHVLCLFKDRLFRPPPEPTVLLVDEGGTVIGREVLPGSEPLPDGMTRVVHLGKSFVLFPGRATRGRPRFVLPPVPFPELDGVPGVHRVVSASPDARQDECLRERFRIPAKTDVASVLVGFDTRNP